MRLLFKPYVSVPLIVFVLAGCSTVLKGVRLSQDSTVNELFQAVPHSAELDERIRTYQLYASKFQKFHDSGVLDETDVLDILKDRGVIRGGTGKGTKQSTPARKPPVRAYGGKYKWPTHAGVVSSEFGNRWGKAHKGVDVAADVGEPVYASAAGVVIYAGSGLRGYGNVIILRHDDKTTTLYAHNSKLISKDGEKVHSGQLISLLGNTGQSTGPHVHFEIRVGETAVDPRTKLGPSPYAVAEESDHDELAELTIPEGAYSADRSQRL